MQPLLKIQTIPIKIEAQTKRASWQESTDPAPAPKRKPAPAPAPVPAAPRSAPASPQPQPQPDNRVNQNKAAQQRMPAAENTSGSYLQEASNAVQAYNQSGAVGDVAVAEVSTQQSATTEYQTSVASNTAPAQSSQSTSFGYSMDRETFDWNTNTKPQLEYVPASIEYSVAQYPEVVIEYVGEPIYVPASSNPNYVPPPEAKGKA